MLTSSSEARPQIPFWKISLVIRCIYCYLPYSGLLDTLNDMNLKLEEIQKSLDMYLETKRQIFPRFYFLSNDDLLEILGQSKNPEAVSTGPGLGCLKASENP